MMKRFLSTLALAAALVASAPYVPAALGFDDPVPVCPQWPEPCQEPGGSGSGGN